MTEKPNVHQSTMRESDLTVPIVGRREEGNTVYLATYIRPPGGHPPSGTVWEEGYLMNKLTGIVYGTYGSSEP